MSEQLTLSFFDEVEELDTCSHCGESKPKDELWNTASGKVCDDCNDEYFAPCEKCSGIALSETIREVKVRRQRGYPYRIQSEYWCEDCVDRHAVKCEDCDEHAAIDFVYTAQFSLCLPCYEDSWTTCYDCGDLVRYDDAHSTNDANYCQHCYRECGGEAIKSYNYCPDLRFHNGKHSKEKLYLGVELEVECGDQRSGSIAQELLETFDEDEHLFCVKEDGSLNNGFEIVSQPCDLAYHKDKFGWSEILEFFRSHNCKSHDPGTCGLHIHLSRDAMTESAQVKLVHFVNSQAELMAKLARRDSNSFARIVKTKLKRGQNQNYDRYEAVNFKNDTTVELRLFRGTLRDETFLATLELAHALVRFAQNTSAMMLLKKERAKREFLKFVKSRKKLYSNLNEYLIHREID